MISQNSTLLLIGLTLLNACLSEATNHCGVGYCLDCKIEQISGSKGCAMCFNSDIEKIDGFNVPGGQCKGVVPYPNCAVVIMTREGKSCHKCKPKFKLAGEGENITCVSIGIDHCLEYDDSCSSCEPKFRPDNGGDKCEPMTTTIEHCLAYERENRDPSEGAGCYQCKWDYYVSYEKTECLIRKEDEISHTCQDPDIYMMVPPGGEEGFCKGDCHLLGGFFASDMKPQGNNRLLEELLEFDKGNNYCIKNNKFDPEHPFGGHTNWIQSRLAFILCISIIIWK